MIKHLWQRFIRNIDPWLLLFTALVVLYSVLVLYSASNRDMNRIVNKFVFFGVGLGGMWIIANIPQQMLMRLAPPAYILGVLLLLGVALFGEVTYGARRWLNIGVARIQPSEIMKVALPMMLAWYFQRNEASLRWKNYIVAAGIMLLPVAFILKQPDLGTSLLVAAAGFYVLYFAGLSWKLIGAMTIIGSGIVIAMLDWDTCNRVLHEYQCQRIATMLNPMEDPLGSGYHIIQGTIAIGSGGILGRGWLNGTQTHLDFIPERTTDFIFAVLGEEFGLFGNIILLILYLLVIGRGLMIAARASTLFGRLLAGSIALTFFTYAFVNMGMVSGILPVVGVPLPLFSYGGTAMVSLMAGFGILMSINKDRQLMKGG
ncbi:rod shape determining protein RodA [Formivibrio citricus]|uniref:Peptidoglycan glycosyltransferase MrdB n=1 Tax=Formivibrio citricus TaxID=83765 RepID=A0A1I5D332_9NEIS|nr:rod shape-determining protein RodA [Formivibrio citricus]SFN93648.1 rod shape determining protein RodA [Formivibrio citricus]